MRGLWGTYIVTAKGTVFKEDLRNAHVWEHGKYAVIKPANENKCGTNGSTVKLVTGGHPRKVEKPKRGICGIWAASLVGPSTPWGEWMW